MVIKIESSANEFYKHLKKLHTAKERASPMTGDVLSSVYLSVDLITIREYN